MSSNEAGVVDIDQAWWSSAIGRIVAVTGSQAVIMLNADRLNGVGPRPPQIGSLLKFTSSNTGVVIGLVSAMNAPAPAAVSGEREMRLVEIEFTGEFPLLPDGKTGTFRRGVSAYPTLGDPAFMADPEDIARVYERNAATAIRIGVVQQAPTVPAMVNIDDLFGKHVAVLGGTGTGKSCAVALLLRRVIEKVPLAHIVLLDLHREYAAAFGDLAEIVTPESFSLPFWLLNFDEITEILVGPHDDRQADIEILRELIPYAKARFGTNQRRDRLLIRHHLPETGGAAIGVDTPVPYRISDLLALLDETMGRLDLKGELAPYKRLRARIEMISRDPRFAFMFGSLTVQDTMADVLAHIFRVPVGGKPIALLELGGLPSEVINVVVSVLSRLAFDFGIWNNAETPIALVCEEAHRYAPADALLGFEPAKRALSRIAKEGRKYGISLIVVSQRPAELDPTLLSQCSTIFTMRLSNERDQAIIHAAISDASAGLLTFVPSMGSAEATIFGEGVPLPARVRFDTLPETQRPRSPNATFSEGWHRESVGRHALDAVVQRWRAQGRADTPASSPTLTPKLAQVLTSTAAGNRKAMALRRDAAGTMPPTGSGEPSSFDAMGDYDTEPQSEQARPEQTPTEQGGSDSDAAPNGENQPVAEPNRIPPGRSGHAVDWRSLRMRIIAAAKPRPGTPPWEGS